MTPGIKDTWRESRWIQRAGLIWFTVCAVLNGAVGSWTWLIMALFLLLWQWGDMGKTVEIARWRSAYVNDPSKFQTRGTVEHTADGGIIYQPPTAVTVNVRDVIDAHQKAQKIADLRKRHWPYGR